MLGLASWTSGDLGAAHRAYSDCLTGLRRAGHVADTFGCSIAMADIRRSQGRLGDAMRTYEQALRLASKQGGSVLRGTADMYVGMSELHRERNDLPAATQHLLHSQELGAHIGLPQNPYRWRVAMARIREAEGDLGGALDLLNEAEHLYVSDYFPNVRPVPALRARVLVAQGALGEALGWAREQGLSVHDDLSYPREFDHVTLARVLLAQAAVDHADRAERLLHEATQLLARLVRAAEEGGRTGSVIEILVLQALAHQSLGDVPAALVPLQEALPLAEPQGYVRVFVDEGPAMASLLRAAARMAQGEHQAAAPSYVRRLLAAVEKTSERTPLRQGLADLTQGSLEPLSRRELDVLRLLGTDLDGPYIARELVVSLNTVRTHTKNIYAKLGVNNRRAAVRRAEELDLLSRTRDR
jgi:LuxR family maltose regulon positive regulatory protein